MSDAILRRIAMLREIPAHPGKIDSVELRRRLVDAGYDVSLRTVQRDLDTCSRTLPIVNDSNEVHYGWSWQKGASQILIPNLEPSIALTLKLAEAHLSSVLPARCLEHLSDYFDLADQVLSDCQKNKLGTWKQKIALAQRSHQLLPPRLSGQVFDVISNALLDEVCVDLEYKRANEHEAKKARVSPIGIILRSPLLYLVCRFWDYSDVRQLAFHRIQKAERTDEPTAAVKDFELQRYVTENDADIIFTDAVELKLRVVERCKVYLDESPISPNQQWVTEEDGLFLLADVKDTLQLRQLLLGYAGEVTVIYPAEMRDWMIAAHTKQLRDYQIEI